MMQGHSIQANVEDDEVILLQKNKQPQQYGYDRENGLSLRKSVNPELRDRALAFATFGPVMIETKGYRLRNQNK